MAFTGIFQSFTILGPALGLIGSGAFLHVWGDLGKAEQP
jgi:hypothetical protein